jgi:hypothetical protein
MKRWVILDDTGKVIGTCEGSAQDARDMWERLEKELPWDEHSWSLYERSLVK